MVLVLVLSVLTISYASSLKAYFQQHSQIQSLRAQIASSQTSIHELESEKQRWQDPAYVKEQARARFGYLMPGETSYVVIGADGKPLAAQATLSDPRTTTTTTPTAWWTAEWKSVELAGNPPTAAKRQPLKYLPLSRPVRRPPHPTWPRSRPSWADALVAPVPSAIAARAGCPTSW
jgi:hypothetical protein